MHKILQNCTNTTVINNGYFKTPRIITCGKCELCKASKSMEWKLRAFHELLEYKGKACFITLTYNNKHLIKANKNISIKLSKKDKEGTLVKEHMQQFTKKLKEYNKNIKYLYCGEYGTERHRPHYHAIIYGIDHFESQSFDWSKFWNKGYIDIDKRPVTEQAIMYVLGYVRKKIGQHDIDYEAIGRVAPYQRQSQGFGRAWALKNAKHYVNSMNITTSRGIQPVPRYYLKQIYKKEGITVRYSTNTKHLYYDANNLLEDVKKVYNKYNYIVIKNTRGELTHRILKNRIKKNKLNAKEGVEHGIDFAKYLAYITRLEKEGYSTNAKYAKMHQKNISFNKKYKVIHKQGVVKNEMYQELYSYIPLAIQQKIKTTARRKEKERKGSPFGYRKDI